MNITALIRVPAGRRAIVTATIAVGALVTGLTGSGSLASAGTVRPGIKTLSVTTTSLPAATAGVPYSAKLAATGGVRPYTWSISGGALPAGLKVSHAGLISGTPKAGGTADFTAQVTDSESPAATATADLSIAVGVAPLVATTISDLPTALVGVPYAVQMNADGGSLPYAWSISSGALPAGLKISHSGLISGTPTTAGTASFFAQVTDSESPPASSGTGETLTVTTPLNVVTMSLPDATVGQPYSAFLQASGGVPPYIWQTGSIAPGLILNLTTGEIEGTPTTAGSFNFTALVRDQSVPEATASGNVSITVNQGS